MVLVFRKKETDASVKGRDQSELKVQKEDLFISPRLERTGIE